MPAPLVSVCIGTYNREEYIRQTLEDVFQQTYPNLEIIVVDDASTDRTLDILKSYGDRLRLLQRETNSGICPVTRNQAWKAAQGKYVALLDSDDGWYPEKIEKQVDLLETINSIPLCHTYCRIIDADSHPQGIRHEDKLPQTGPYFKALLKHCIITNSSVLMHNDLHEQVGGRFVEDKRYGIWGEDLEFYLRVASRYEIGLVEAPLTKYRRSNANVSAGNWKHIPESLPAHELILDRPDIWSGVVSRSDVLDAVIESAESNAEYWSYQGMPLRVLWFYYRALHHRWMSPFLWGKSMLNALRSLKNSFIKVQDNR